MGLHIHIHMHAHADEETKKSLLSIHQKLDKIMTTQERFDTILTGIDEVTNEIAADYQALIEAARNNTVSEESLARAEANVARLKQVAASNDQPVPGTEIPPATEPGNGGVTG